MALDELKSGWERTQSPLIGLEWVRMLTGLERYSEADRHLSKVEEALGIPVDATEEEIDELLQPVIPVEEALAAIEAFEQLWPRVARRAPRAVPKRSSKILPVLTWKKLPPPEAASAKPSGVAGAGAGPGASTGASGAGASGAGASSGASAPQGVLEDLAPELPVPSDVAGVPSVRQIPTQQDDRIDLWLVDKLLREMHTLPIQSPDDTMGQGQELGQRQEAGGADPSLEESVLDTPSRPAVNPWAGADSGAAAERSAHDEPMDTDDYGPFRPTIGKVKGYARFFPTVFDPVKEAVALRRILKEHLSPKLHMGGFFNGRTGTTGSTELFSGFADLRMAFQLPGFRALTLEPYVQPGMVTDGADFQSGTMAGLGLAARAGRISLDARLGTSPLGFRGGISMAGQARIELDVAELLRVGVEGAMEPVADSLTSWAGAETDVGAVFGFVSRARGGGTLTLRLDGNTSLSLGGDFAEYSGLALKRNLWRQGRMGFYHLLKADEGSVELRIRTTAFGFTYQQDAFEIGSGGYFSPLLFLVATGGGYWKAQSPDARLEWLLGLDAGMQYVEGEETESLTPGIRPVLSAGAELTYMLSPGLNLGAKYEFDNAGADYTRNTVWIYLSRTFLSLRDRRPEER